MLIRRFLRSSLSMTWLYAGSTLLSFVSGVLLARLMGASEYGAYALALTTSTLAGLAAEFGLPTLAMREAARAHAVQSWGSLRGLLEWSDRVILVSSVVLAMLCFGGVALAPHGGSPFLRALAWGMVLVPAVAIGKLRSMVLLAFDRVVASQFPIMIGRPVLFIGASVIIWYAVGRLSASWAMAAQAGAATFVAAVTVVLLRRRRPPALAKAEPRCAVREWLATCLPMGLSEALRLLQGQLALLMIGLLTTTASAGIYRVADAAVQLSTLVWSVVGTATTPLFARLHGENDRDGLESVAVLAAWAMLAGSLALGAPVAVAGHWLFADVFGAEFVASVTPFSILWAGTLVSATFGLPLAIATMTGHHVLAMRSFTVIVLANAVVGAVLIPLLGASGGAIASAVASCAGSGYCSVRLRQRTGINASVFNARSGAMLRDAVHNLAQWRRRRG